MSKKLYLTQKQRLQASARIAKKYRKKLKITKPDYYKEIYQAKKETEKHQISLSLQMIETLRAAANLDSQIPKSIKQDAKIEMFIDNLIYYWMKSQDSQKQALKEVTSMEEVLGIKKGKR